MHPYRWKTFFALLLAVSCLGVCAVSYAGLAEVEVALLNRDYNQAEKLAGEILAAQPKNAAAQKAQYYLGLSQLQQGRYQEALDSFGKVKKDRLEPGLRDRLYLGTFDAYYLQEKYEQANDTLQNFLKDGIKPEALSLVYFKLAKANLKLARWNQATGYLERVVRSFPNSLEVPAARQLLEEKHYFAVQVGAFAERQFAEALVDELKQKQEYAYIVETVDQQNKKFYRVRVGQLAMLKEAQNLKTRLARLGYPTQIYP